MFCGTAKFQDKIQSFLEKKKNLLPNSSEDQKSSECE